MGDFVTLMGADNVERAGGRMREAAGEMSNAAASIEASLHGHRMFLEDWLMRFAAILEKHGEKESRT